MVQVSDYFGLRFKYGGRSRPEVDCWGLYRLIVGEKHGIWLPDYEGVETPLAIAKTLRRENKVSTWLPVVPGQERECDLVLMHGMIGEGATAAMAPMHVGCVTRPGMMVDIEIGSVHPALRAFRSTSRSRAHPAVVHRVLGIYRPEALA